MWTIDQRVRERLAARRITLADLALATGHSVPCLRRALRPDADPPFLMASAIALALGEPVDALFVVRWAEPA